MSCRPYDTLDEMGELFFWYTQKNSAYSVDGEDDGEKGQPRDV
jgi:hypothetical protein